MALTPSQESSLQQYLDITSLPRDVGLEILNREGWDLEVAVNQWVQDPSGSTTRAKSHRTRFEKDEMDALALEEMEGGRAYGERMETMAVDDSEVTPFTNAQPGRGGPGNGWGLALRRVFSSVSPIIAFPISLFASILSFISRLLHLRSLFPYLGVLRPRNPFDLSPRNPLSPGAAAEHYIRFLEETTGYLHPESTPVAKGTGAFGEGGSGLIQRKSGTTSSKVLPEFMRCGYSEALQAAKDQLKVLMVVLSSVEHEDDEVFRKTVLTDTSLREAIAENDILIWGGDVKYRDAYQVSLTLAIPRLPAVAFIALQPRTNASSLSTHNRPVVDPIMKMFSRLAGSPTSTTSANSITLHIQNSVVPRVGPFLGRMKGQRRAREEERELRRRQDEDYQRAIRNDTERVLAKRREEEEKERKRVEELERQRKSEELQEKLSRWRFWAANNVIPEEYEGKDAARVAVKLTDGRRVMRTFKADERTEVLYTWIECESNGIAIHPPTTTSGTTASNMSTSTTTTKVGSRFQDWDRLGHEFQFKLIMMFPRKVVETGLELNQVGGMVPNANLVVESLENQNGNNHSEEDEEEEEEEE